MSHFATFNFSAAHLQVFNVTFLVTFWQCVELDKDCETTYIKRHILTYHHNIT